MSIYLAYQTACLTSVTVYYMLLNSIIMALLYYSIIIFSRLFMSLKIIILMCKSRLSRVYCLLEAVNVQNAIATMQTS